MEGTHPHPSSIGRGGSQTVQSLFFEVVAWLHGTTLGGGAVQTSFAVSRISRAGLILSTAALILGILPSPSAATSYTVTEVWRDEFDSSDWQTHRAEEGWQQYDYAVMADCCRGPVFRSTVADPLPADQSVLEVGVAEEHNMVAHTYKEIKLPYETNSVHLSFRQRVNPPTSSCSATYHTPFIFSRPIDPAADLGVDGNPFRRPQGADLNPEDITDVTVPSDPAHWQEVTLAGVSLLRKTDTIVLGLWDADTSSVCQYQTWWDYLSISVAGCGSGQTDWPPDCRPLLGGQEDPVATADSWTTGHTLTTVSLVLAFLGMLAGWAKFFRNKTATSPTVRSDTIAMENTTWGTGSITAPVVRAGPFAKVHLNMTARHEPPSTVTNNHAPATRRKLPDRRNFSPTAGLRAFLEVTYAEYRAAGKWPRLRVVERNLVERGFDFRSIHDEARQALSDNVPADGWNMEVRLPVWTLAYVEAAVSDYDLVVRALPILNEVYRSRKPEPVVNASDFLGRGWSSDDVQLTGRLLQNEWVLFDGNSSWSGPLEWSFSVGSSVSDYLNVSNGRSYLEERVRRAEADMASAGHGW